MRIDVLSKNIEITPSISDYIKKKIGSIELFLKRFEKDGELTLFFEIARTTKHHKRGEIFYAEATLNIFGKTIRAEEHNVNLYKAIDVIKQTLKNDITRYKRKTIDIKIKRKRKNR